MPTANSLEPEILSGTCAFIQDVSCTGHFLSRLHVFGEIMKCPKCHLENPKENNFCRQCGARLVASCPKCGADVLQDDRFCGKCGHRLKKAQEPSLIDYQQPQSYTPRFLAEKILTNRSSIEGERKLVTVLFADIANYTSMAEKLDPEEVHQIMHLFLGDLYRIRAPA